MPPRKLPPDDVVVEMYRSGLSCGEIAERTGVRSVTVDSCLRRIGERLRTPAEAAVVRGAAGRNNTPRYWLGRKKPAEMVERRVSKIRGERHYLWKGGAERRPYRKVRAKDMCARCGDRERLALHHVDLDHYNDDPANLQVLCVSCHSSVHKQAYWDAIHAGEEPPRSNAPNGWQKRRSGNEHR